MSDEIARRRALVAERATDIERWSRPESYAPQWAMRAGLAAQFIPAYSTVLDIGAGAMDLERALPPGCVYRPCDLVRRDARTIVCDLNLGEFPDEAGADVVTMLGVLEYLTAPLEVLRKVRALNRPLVCSYSITDRRPDMDRASQGWINGFDFAGLRAMMARAGFRLQHRQAVDPLQDIFKWIPDDGAPPARAPVPKRVLILSYYNDSNFGDRLGYHIVNGLLPPDAVVTHASVTPWSVPDEPFDLFILGIGNSLNAATLVRPELHRLIETIPHTVGIFGAQYRHHYAETMGLEAFDALLGKLTTWWARYEEDVNALGRGHPNVRHLGDLLISAFPMATPHDPKTLVIAPDIGATTLPLDRLIQQIQSYRRVASARVHPMLCALTSAEEVQYQEQAEFGDERTSGKFRSQLIDVFGRTFDEKVFFKVDRQAVIRYKRKVEANLAELRAQLADLLA